jgi:hypothetical protein
MKSPGECLHKIRNLYPYHLHIWPIKDLLNPALYRSYIDFFPSQSIFHVPKNLIRAGMKISGDDEIMDPILPNQ